ncbi:hypothetical protein [Hymenobacter arizonensis]|uniref:hypothetical protein n=1 Tax=Hymenobacter arizonensis TaxID=1227077 RepID=UPI00116054E2|nr:hypothetical protein [Hymenobacter arizonensis]
MGNYLTGRKVGKQSAGFFRSYRGRGGLAKPNSRRTYKLTAGISKYGKATFDKEGAYQSAFKAPEAASKQVAKAETSHFRLKPSSASVVTDLFNAEQ